MNGMGKMVESEEMGGVTSLRSDQECGEMGDLLPDMMGVKVISQGNRQNPAMMKSMNSKTN